MTCLGSANNAPLSAPDLDAHLHAERLASGGSLRETGSRDIDALPDGVMVCADSRPHAVRDGKLLAWSFAGYGDPVSFDGFHSAAFHVLTPETTVEALRAGYRPVWHEAAAS